MIQQIKGWAVPLLLIGIAIVCAAVLEEPLAPVLAFIDEHQTALVAVCAALMAVGFVAFLGTGLFVLLWPQAPSDPTSSTAPAIDYSGTRRQPGRINRDFYVETSFHSVKDALRSGGWWSDPEWRVLFIMMAGALLLFFGLFALFLVIGPLTVKLIVAGAMLYAVIRLGWGFARA
jgi:hypothetical protein